jgi:hypothetical protein
LGWGCCCWPGARSEAASGALTAPSIFGGVAVCVDKRARRRARARAGGLVVSVASPWLGSEGVGGPLVAGAGESSGNGGPGRGDLSGGIFSAAS